MARVVAVGQPTNESERSAIRHLRDYLPDSFTVIHNFELNEGVEVAEIDLAIVGPHCVFVVDVKGTRGRVDVHGSKWYPEGRQAFHSPLAKLRQHAKVLKSLVCARQPANVELRRIHIQEAVLMTAPEARVHDRSGEDVRRVTSLGNAAAFFTSTSLIPPGRSDDIRPLHRQLERAVLGLVHPPSESVRFGQWQVDEQLSATDRYVEYRAHHALLGSRAGTALLRAYRVDPYLPDAERARQRHLVSTAYRALCEMPGHPNIVAPREFFATEGEDRLVLVTEDPHGQPIRQHLSRADLSLTLDQKFAIVGDMLSGLEHAHRARVVHRNLTPDSVLFCADGRARLTDFDYARVQHNGSDTIAREIVDDVDQAYQAPECFRDPSAATVASDLFSAGLVIYELLTGQHPFRSSGSQVPEEIVDRSAQFQTKASDLCGELPEEFDSWLQRLCAFKADERPVSAGAALVELDTILGPGPAIALPGDQVQPTVPSEPELRDLPRGYVLNGRFVIQTRLGRGGFAVAYKVLDTLGDVVRVIKLVTRDRSSVYERLRQEYRALVGLPAHPHVVEVIYADRFPDGTPYILFPYVDGLSVDELIRTRALSTEEAVGLVLQACEGLVHLHGHGVFHRDIKPSNLIWTDQGVRIIDFNVAVSAGEDTTTGGGTRRYLPPDHDGAPGPDAEDLADRDVYALGLVLYETVSGEYPFEESTPPLGQVARDPRSLAGCADLSKELVDVLLRAIAPRRADRYRSAQAMLDALREVTILRQPVALAPEPAIDGWPTPSLEASTKPNYNPFVAHLLTMYSQSKRTNAGTRGLDTIGAATYVPTLLDTALVPRVLAGGLRLVVMSGNAGDGKTAFLQQLERRARQLGADVKPELNGSRFAVGDHEFLTNYDGSQDEGPRTNDEVLLDFFGPFAGETSDQWPTGETRLIAINEGRLTDFLAQQELHLPRLAAVVRAGLQTGEPTDGVAVVNLNLRAVVADGAEDNDSIFDRLVARLTHQQFWEACGGCDLRSRCYVYHNYRSLSDPVAGSKITARLKGLYTLTHLRGRLHITLRDLRSALAFTLAGQRDCDEIHELYDRGGQEARKEILSGFYFNSWSGGLSGSEDRLLRLLGEVDVGSVTDPELDRSLAMPQALNGDGRFPFAERGDYDEQLLRATFDSLPRDFAGKAETRRFEAHQEYLAMRRRRHFFERRDEGWQGMLPYRSATHFLALVSGSVPASAELEPLLSAVNRGEGVGDPVRLGQRLALRVRQVDRGSIQSYRLFDGDQFEVVVPDPANRAAFVEHMPQGLVLMNRTAASVGARLEISLDIYEMLWRLNGGYRPSLEERQGLYLSLAVFKNVLASAPYQEVLVTETGHDFFRISRSPSGVLTLEPVPGGPG
jgi:serine/threonine protein kinase